MIVHPTHQRQGIGRAMMAAILKDYAHTAIYVACLTGTEDFFVKCGLKNQSRLTALAAT